MTDSTKTSPDAVAADELHALAVLQRLKSEVEQSGLSFAARMITPSGRHYRVATDETDNIAAWIFEQDERAMSSDPTALASPPSRSRMARALLRSGSYSVLSESRYIHGIPNKGNERFALPLDNVVNGWRRSPAAIPGDTLLQGLSASAPIQLG